MTLLGPGLPSLATVLFNCPIRGIMPIIRRQSVSVNNDEGHYEALVNRQIKDDKTKVLPEIMFLFP